MSEWKGGFYGFARAVDNTPENRQTWGGIFANNGSGESVENESKGLDAVFRFSVSGELPVQVFGVSTLIKVPMWSPIKAFFEDTLTDSRYFVRANVDVTYQGTDYLAGELVETNSAFAVVGQPFAWDDAVDALNAERAAQSKAPLLLIEDME